MDSAADGFGGMAGGADDVLGDATGRVGNDGAGAGEGRAGRVGVALDGFEVGDIGCIPALTYDGMLIFDEAVFSAAQSDSASTSRAVLVSVCMNDRPPDPYPFGPH